MSNDTSRLDQYHGVWTIKSHPLAFRSLTKCACSTVGQVMHYIESGEFFSGDIHEDRSTLMKWGHEENHPAVAQTFQDPNVVSFTVTRNPYRRLLSAFSDKMVGFAAGGGRYRGGELHVAAEPYGVHFGPDANIFDVFQGFARFVAVSIRNRTNLDYHWSPTNRHLRFNIHDCPDWRLQHVGYVEHLADDLPIILSAAGVDTSQVPQKVPRENTTSIGFSCEQMYRSETIEIVKRTYAADFEVFGYSADLDAAEPVERRSGPEVYDRLASIYRNRRLRA